MKTAEIFSKAIGLDITSEDCHEVLLLRSTLEIGLKAVEKALQWDYSKSCECKQSTGETWCCNICGLPTSKHSVSEASTNRNISIDSLNEVDEILAYLEDFMHGKDGADITHARKLIEQTITELNMPLTKVVSITDQEIKERANMGIYANSIEFDVRDMFISGAKWARDEMLKRTAPYIDRDKAIEVIMETILPMYGDDEYSLNKRRFRTDS